MLTKKRYSLKEIIIWTKAEIFMFFILSIAVAILYSFFKLEFLQVPWTPVALIGTAVAFVLGFQNNSAYGRIWEARKIWGGIVNTSRMWGMNIKDMITNEHVKDSSSLENLDDYVKHFVKRHIVWLTALRHAMRQPKKWEVYSDLKSNNKWSEIIHIPERKVDVIIDLKKYLSESEMSYVENKSNKPAAILFLQSSELKKLKESGHIWEFSYLELQSLLNELFTLQGKSERIKNFPYPRQYATLSHIFVWIFLILLPFGLIPEFSKIGQSFSSQFPIVGDYFVIIGVFFCVVVSWVFYTMERIGRTGENPFEGTPNDVPISTISRGIEIDLLQLLNEDKESIPSQFPENYDVQM